MKSPRSKRRICTAFWPSRVIRPPPSMTVSTLFGRFIVAVTGIVTGALPQLNVTIPPRVTAAFSAENVQLAAVPFPTTVVGLETFAGWALAGSALVQRVGISRLSGGGGGGGGPAVEAVVAAPARVGGAGRSAAPECGGGRGRARPSANLACAGVPRRLRSVHLPGDPHASHRAGAPREGVRLIASGRVVRVAGRQRPPTRVRPGRPVTRELQAKARREVAVAVRRTVGAAVHELDSADAGLRCAPDDSSGLPGARQRVVAGSGEIELRCGAVVVQGGGRDAIGVGRRRSVRAEPVRRSRERQVRSGGLADA